MLAFQSMWAFRAIENNFIAVILIYTFTFVLLAGLLALCVRLCFVFLIAAPHSTVLSTPIVLFADIQITHTVVVFDKVTCTKNT